MKIVKEIFSILLFNRITWSKYCQVYLNLFEDINEDGGEDLCLNQQNKIAQKFIIGCIIKIKEIFFIYCTIVQ